MLQQSAAPTARGDAPRRQFNQSPKACSNQANKRRRISRRANCNCKQVKKTRNYAEAESQPKKRRRRRRRSQLLLNMKRLQRRKAIARSEQTSISKKELQLEAATLCARFTLRLAYKRQQVCCFAQRLAFFDKRASQKQFETFKVKATLLRAMFQRREKLAPVANLEFVVRNVWVWDSSTRALLSVRFAGLKRCKQNIKATRRRFFSRRELISSPASICAFNLRAQTPNGLIFNKQHNKSKQSAKLSLKSNSNCRNASPQTRFELALLRVLGIAASEGFFLHHFALFVVFYFVRCFARHLRKRCKKE